MTAMDITTNWVMPPNQITGLDHLGVQAPCINIYAQLLPGITNVTDRARYYSFYPWLLMAMADDGYSYGEEFISDFRKADALFTLICLRHQEVCDDGHHHADAAVGSIALTKALSVLNTKITIKISDYSSRDAGEARYFMNKLGGLGQYYIGVLRGLHLMDGNSRDGVQTIKDIGGLLAKQFAHNLPVDKFLSVVKADQVTLKDLDALSDFCLCQLTENTAEKKAMVKLFAGEGPFKGKDKFTDEDSLRRKQSLGYILQLAEATSEYELDFDIDTFRSLTYCHAFSEEHILSFDKSLQTVVDGWASYQRNELLSMALQGLFYACLRAYELSGLNFSNVQILADWFWKKGPGYSALKKVKGITSFDALQKKLLKQMPVFAEWQEDNHEIQCMYQLRSLSRMAGVNKEQLEDMVLDALRILCALAGRPENQAGYSEGLFFPLGYFDYYPVNLNSFLTHLGGDSGDWNDLPLQECLTNVLSQWCLNAHLRVALRKLRQQSQSTFRFMPTDNGLSIVDIPKAAHTQPRFNQARTILKDIGLLVEDEDGYLILADNALQLLNDDNEAA